MNTINATAAGADSEFRSWIDTPESATLTTRRAVIRGWCYHRGGTRIGAIRARVERRPFVGRHGSPRPDVAAAFGQEPGSEGSGYEIAASFPGGRSECVLEAQLEGDSEWRVFGRFVATAPRASRLRDRLRWARFWTRAWLGRRDAWNDLAPADRDYLIAWARQRNLLNLHLAPQHEPRPVALERFPTTSANPRTLPKITAVTPSYQQGAFLEATLRSVLDQSGVRLDYIVQDGGSTDESVGIIKAHASRLKRWESRPDGGQADAIGRGFADLDCGPDDLMMYLNSDDLLMPGAARFAAEYFARHPEIDVLYGHRVLIDEAGQDVGRWMTPRRECDDLRLHDLIPQETLFWRRRIWDRVGGIDPSFQFALDWDLLLRFAAAGARFARVPRFLGMFRLHTQQKSQAQLDQRGIPEMDRLRLRTLGRVPNAEEMHLSMRRAQLDSALLLALWRKGIRA